MSRTSSPPRPSAKRHCGRISISTAAMVCVAGVLAGCTALEPDAGAAVESVNAFAQALAVGDGDTACGVLTESAREAIEDTTGASCSAGILTLNLAVPTASTAEVFSRAAFVEANGTAVFLTAGDDGWLIRAAGCTPVSDAPFDCVVDGS